MLELPRLDHLRGEVCPLVGDEAPRAVDPVRGEEPPREQSVDRAVQPERVPGNQPAHLVAQDVGVAQPPQDAPGDLRPELRVVGARSVCFRLREVVEQRAEARLEPLAGVRRALDDLEHVLVERRRLPGRAEVVADRRLELGEELDERTGVPREPERRRGLLPEEELRKLPHPVGIDASADSLGGDVPQARGFRAHLCERVVREREGELGEQSQAAEYAQGVLTEAVRACGVELAPLEVGEPSERIDELPGLEAPRHRIDGEVTAGHVVGDRDGRVGDDLEVPVPGADAPLLPRRRQLDTGGRESPDPGVPRVEADADELPVHLHVLHPTVRLECRAEAGVVDPGDEEVLVGVRDAEQLVAHRAPDDVRVEVERADVAADFGLHDRARYISPGAQRWAIASISTSAPDGSFATWNVERAGGRSPTRAA